MFFQRAVVHLVRVIVIVTQISVQAAFVRVHVLGMEVAAMLVALANVARAVLAVLTAYVVVHAPAEQLFRHVVRRRLKLSVTIHTLQVILVPHAHGLTVVALMVAPLVKFVQNHRKNNGVKCFGPPRCIQT